MHREYRCSGPFSPTTHPLIAGPSVDIGYGSPEERVRGTPLSVFLASGTWENPVVSSRKLIHCPASVAGRDQQV